MLKNLESVLLAISRAVIVSAFRVASRIFHKVEVHGVEHDSVEPRTYSGIMHERDLDPIIIIPAIGYENSPHIYHV